MNINPTRYIVSINPKPTSKPNVFHEEVNGSVCSIVDIVVGKRGWIAVWEAYDESWHRYHLSTVESIITDESNGEATQVIVTTRNTVYTFKKIEEPN